MAVTKFHLHLVSDSTGETVHSVARACLVQFDGSQAVEHVWSMVRTRSQIERVIAGVEANKGVVLFTLVSDTLRLLLQEGLTHYALMAGLLVRSFQQEHRADRNEVRARASDRAAHRIRKSRG